MNYTKVLSKLKQLRSIDTTTVNTLYTLSEKSLLTAILFSIIITIALYSELSYSIVLWCGVVVIISLLRLYHAYLFKTSPQIYSIERWYKYFVILAFLTGLTVSTLGFWFIYDLNEYYQLFVLASLLGLTAGATISLSSDYKIAIAYISIIILPLIVPMSMQQTSLRFILPILLILFYITQIILIFKNYAQEENIKKLIKDNEDLLDENKSFIADMVHQIRTPLTVIMGHTSFIEIKASSTVMPHVKQINAAINVLSNSYEDLSYIISNDTLEYKAIEINFSHFINERINFFEIIADTNYKTISSRIDKNITIFMNDTELERLIDNNLSNAIKHSYEKSNIEIILEKTNIDIILKFISKGENIVDTSRIFDKSYTESNSAKRSLGLGLNMVKEICEKNNIDFSVHSKDNINTFTYTFKT